nr:hypothetical protein [Tanacetum cinerariifolium]
MATTIEQQVALDETLVPSAQRLRIGRSNFRLPSDIQSKESTLQVVYDVLRQSPFFKAFLMTADVPEIYMQEFWATTTVYQHSIRFKMDTRKHIVDLELFREMLHISPRVPGQSFAELPFEEEILEFLTFLGHSAQIKTLTDVNVNKLYQPWRSFAAVINKCLTGKSTGFDSLRLSAAAKCKQPARARSPTEPLDVERIEAEQLKIVLRMSRHEMHISQQGGSGIDKGTGSKPGEEESFDPIPRTPEESEDDGNDKEDQVLRIGEEEMMQEEEKADELYRDVDINQGRGLQVSQDIEDSHVTLTPTHSDDEQRNLYKALVEAYDAEKTILDTYRESAILKRRREEDDDQEGPFAGSDRGSKRRREEGEHASASTPSEPATGSAGRSTTGTQSRQLSASESAFAEELMQTACQMEEPSHLVFETGTEDPPIVQTSQHPEWFSQPRRPPTPDRDWNKTLPAAQGNAQSWISALAKQTDARSSFNELLDTLIDFSNFIMNRLSVYTLTPELLAGPTYELMRGSCNSPTELEYHLEEPLPLILNNWGHRVIPFEHFINNDLEYLREGASSRKYTTSVTKTKATDYGHIKWIEDLESALDVYSKRRIIAVTELKIVEWHNYKHLDWILVCHDDDKIYKFKEGDLKRLCLQDIKDMLLLLVQGKLSNLTVEECFAFNVSLRMFTRSIVIQRCVEDLQLGVESYQKRLNLTKPDTYQSDLKRRKAYTAYSNPIGFIYQNKDKKKRLMRIDELHKFSDGTLNDVRNAFNDRLKGIRMQYLPTTIWRRGDKDRAAAMI